MVWAAAELLAPEEPLPQTAALHLETGMSRLVSFEWNADTGELSFTAGAGASALTLPEDFVNASDRSIENFGSR
jgi:hypothetical protein